MKTEYKELVAVTKQDDNTKKWCYIISKNNSYDTSILHQTDFKYHSEAEALKAVDADGEFDKYIDE
jgi:hypothetical protein